MRWQATAFDPADFVRAGGTRLGGTKILVCGSRAFSDFKFLAGKLDTILFVAGTGDKRSLIFISGNNPRKPRPKGVDDMVVWWCGDRRVPHMAFAADWDAFGRGGGPIRNGWMIKEAPSLVVAFPGGDGTANCCRQADEAGIPVWEISV